MAFISVTVYNKPVSVSVVLRDGNEPIIRIGCGDGSLCCSPAEAVKLRDELSRTIVEAATAAAQAVQAEGAAA